MSVSRKALLALAAVVLLVTGFIFARSEDDKKASKDSTTAVREDSSETTPNSDDGADKGGDERSHRSQKQAERKGKPVQNIVKVRGGKPVGGVAKLKARKGERVRFTVTSDKPEEVHLHVYDIERQAAPDKPAKFSFKADIEGVFEVELHSTATQIAELRVEP